MSGGIRVPSKEWAEKYTGFKAVICLQYSPTRSPEEELRVGVAMVVVGKEAPRERELWELVRHRGSGGHRHGSLEFRKCTKRESFMRWSKSIRPTICGITGTKKPVLFLSRYLLSEDPTTPPFRGDREQANGSVSAIGSTDWKDLGVDQEVDQLIQTASFLCKELNPFVTVCVRDEAFTCFVLEKGRLDAATRHFHEIRKAVLDVLSGIELEREAIVQLCPTLSSHGSSAMAVLDRVLNMDRWCTVVPGIHCGSEIQVYRRRHDGVPSYGLMSAVKCEKCGSVEGQDNLALCDYCGSGVHLHCISHELRRSFLLASEEQGDWFCSKQCATLSLPPPNSSPPNTTPPHSNGTSSCEVVDSDDAQKEDSQARRGIPSQQVGRNAAAPSEGVVGSPHTAVPDDGVRTPQRWEQDCAGLMEEQKQAQDEVESLMNGNFQVEDHDVAVTTTSAEQAASQAKPVMSEGVGFPSKEWVAKYTGFKAVICLQYSPTRSPEEEELRVGVAMVVEGKEAPRERELWELVRHRGSGGHRHGSLEFRKYSGRDENFSSWSKSIRPSIGSIYRAKKPVLFLSRYLLSEDPTTPPFRTKDKGKQANAQGCSTIESADWKDLGVDQEAEQLIEAASFLCKELKPFKTVCVRDEAFTCFVLEKGRLDAATRHFHEIRKAVLDVLSGIELEREALVQLCPTLSSHGSSAMAVLDRVLNMDRWCRVVPGIHCESEIQVYRRRHDGVPSYGLMNDIKCKECGGVKDRDLALCDYCGSGVHLHCASHELRRSFLLATEERRDWFCSKQCTTLSLPPPNSSPPNTTPPHSNGTSSCEVVDSDDAQEEDSQARRGISSQQVGRNAAAPSDGVVGSTHTAVPGGEVWSTQRWKQHCAVLKAEQKQVQDELESLMDGNFQVEDHDAAVLRRAWLLDRLEKLYFEISRAERQARAPPIRQDERGKAPLRPSTNLRQEMRSDSGSDLSVRMQESYHNKRAKTSAHVRGEGLRNAQVEVGGAEYDVGQRVHGNVASGDRPDAGRQQQQGLIHSSSPQVEVEGEANVRLVQTPNPIARTPLSRATANNPVAGIARCATLDSQTEGGGSREGRVDATGNAEQRDADRRMSYTEAQLFPGDASLRWFNKDVRELMNNQNSRCDFLEHLFHTIFPKFVEAAPQDHDAISDLVYELINVEQLSPLNEGLEKKLFSHLCDLHNSLLRCYATMQSRVKQKLLPKTFVLLDRVYSTPERALTPEKLIVEGEQDSVFLPFLEDGS